MSFFSKETDPAINFAVVDKDALAMLEVARSLAGIPFKITSHARTAAHSVEVGGIKDDAHTEVPCTAFDIACSDSRSRLAIVKAVLEAGFTRLGFNSKHVHVDRSPSKPQNVLWLE